MTKLTIIGAGSAVFTKNIFTDLMFIDDFKKMDIALVDIDEKRLKISHELLDVIAKKLNASPNIKSYTNRKEALAGSDFVQSTIQVGGYKPSTVIDFDIPNQFGLKQTIADTLGIGGIMRGLRTIPVLVDIGKDIMDLCPNSLWLQYVNPMCSNMIAINNACPGIKSIGLCHSVQGTAEMLARDLNEKIEDIDYLCAGINHMAFYKKFTKKNGNGGEDLYPKLKKLADDIVSDKITSTRSIGKDSESDKVLHEKVRYEILRRFGYFVTESSEHFAEYVPWFIKNNRQDLIDKYKLNEKNPSNIQGVIVTGVEDNSPAEEAGLQEGDIITRVGRKKIYSTKDFLSEMSKFDDESKVLFLVKRGSSSRFITITR